MSVDNVGDPNEIVEGKVEGLEIIEDGMDSSIRKVGDTSWPGEGPACTDKDYVKEWEGQRDSYTFTPNEVGGVQKLLGVDLDRVLGEHLIVHDPDALKLEVVPFPSEPANVEAPLSAEEVAAQAAKVDRIAAGAVEWLREVLARG